MIQKFSTMSRFDLTNFKWAYFGAALLAPEDVVSLVARYPAWAITMVNGMTEICVCAASQTQRGVVMLLP